MKIPNIQPAMQEIVDFINDNGYVTTDSGDGITNVEAGMEGAMPFPHVVVRSSKENLISDADSLSIILGTNCCYWKNFQFEATYFPKDEVACILISMEKI